MPQDLKNFIGVPVMIPATIYAPARVVTDAEILQWIRWAEDDIEQKTNIRLCQTWVAAPAAALPEQASNVGLITKNGGGQQLGIDYDFAEPAYDFHFDNAQDDGWMVQKLRWKPIQGPDYNDPNGFKNYAYIYPLLNAYFRVFMSWFVTDKDYGMIRLVPATNVQMLPLFAMQITFQGFSNSVPGGLWFQYVAGLNPNDYKTNYAFILRLVLAAASITGLSILQGSINLGVTDMQTSVDGLAQRIAYPGKGPYSGLIANLQAMVKDDMRTAKSRVGGYPLIIL